MPPARQARWIIMKSALITGIHGFVGTHMCRRLLKQGYRVSGFDRGTVGSDRLAAIIDDKAAFDGVQLHTCDLADISEIKKLLERIDCDHVFHLAGTAFVPDAWADPAGAFTNNTLNTIHLLQAMKDLNWRGRFLYVSSSDVYGQPAPEAMPINETSVPDPKNPYAASKLAAEQFALCLNAGLKDMEIIIARPFNHIGPAQRPSFVVPEFLTAMEEAKASGATHIRVGDINSARDFTDVRDVTQAYQILLERGQSGEIYNVCSGKPTTIQEIFERAREVVGASVEYKVDEGKLRPEGSDVRYGQADKLRALGWEPQFTLADSIRDAHEFMNRVVPA